MRKIVLLDDHFPRQGSKRSNQSCSGALAAKDLSRVTKTASEALDYIKHVTPEPGKTNMLVLALGSEEAYGPNRNGDGFPERPVPARGGRGYWIQPWRRADEPLQDVRDESGARLHPPPEQGPGEGVGAGQESVLEPEDAPG